MDKKKKTEQQEEVAEPIEAPAEEQTAEQSAPEPDPVQELEAALAQQKDAYLRLAAEYDNFRKRTKKEQEMFYTEIKAEPVGKFLPVYDNLLRALAQETADEAYKKGVEMTMTGLREIMDGLGVAAFGAVGDSFDPNLHNAIMHREDEAFGESVICEVYQTGFKVGEKVIRHAMVVVAN